MNDFDNLKRTWQRYRQQNRVAANISPLFGISISAKPIAGDIHMRFRKREPLLSILLDTGLHLLDSFRERLPDNMDDLRDRVTDTYGTASERVGRATDALR